jgi:hypothetical protein
MICDRCQGNGVDLEPIPVCCGNGHWECGGPGCHGPASAPQPCRECEGTGHAPDAIDAAIATSTKIIPCSG